MSYNKSPLAFDDIREAFDRALASTKGVRIPCLDRASAVILRSRFNYFRAQNRKENATVYPAEHQLWNRSVYDKLTLRIPSRGTAEEAVLYIEPRIPSDITIEEIQ